MSCRTWNKTDIDDSLHFQGSQNEFSSQNASSMQLSLVVSMPQGVTKANYTPFISAIGFSENLGMNSVLQSTSALDSAIFHIRQTTTKRSARRFLLLRFTLFRIRSGHRKLKIADMVELAIKHCGMSCEEAKTWAPPLRNLERNKLIISRLLLVLHPPKIPRFGQKHVKTRSISNQLWLSQGTMMNYQGHTRCRCHTILERSPNTRNPPWCTIRTKSRKTIAFSTTCVQVRLR